MTKEPEMKTMDLDVPVPTEIIEGTAIDLADILIAALRIDGEEEILCPCRLNCPRTRTKRDTLKRYLKAAMETAFTNGAMAAVGVTASALSQSDQQNALAEMAKHVNTGGLLS